MVLRFLAVAAMVLSVVLASQADETCPALNRTAASTALGGDAQLAVEWHAASDYICTYSAGKAVLRITVTPYHARDGWPSYAAQCFAAPQALTGIGNEAVFCTKDDIAKILSHVRDTYFELSVTGDDAATRRERLRRAAERVASNLF